MKFDDPTEFFASTTEPEVRYESNHCGLTKFQQVGRWLEMAVSEALRTLKVRHKHNHFDYRYAFETEGTDLQTRKDELECKNLSGSYRLRYSWLEDEVVNRFSGRRKKKKRILVISYDNLSRAKRQFLRENKVNVVEVGFQVCHSNFGSAVELLSCLLIPVLHVCGKIGKVCYRFSKLIGYSYRISKNQQFLTSFKGYG